MSLLKYFGNLSYRAEVLVKALCMTNNKFIWYLIHHKLCLRYGIEIGKGAKIGSNLHIAHIGGIVIGDGVSMGNNITIYQTVTLGQKNGQYPVIEDNVIIYPGSIVLGKIHVGKNSVIGANSVVLSNVPENAVVAGNPARILRHWKEG